MFGSVLTWAKLEVPSCLGPSALIFSWLLKSQWPQPLPAHRSGANCPLWTLGHHLSSVAWASCCFFHCLPLYTQSPFPGYAQLHWSSLTTTCSSCHNPHYVSGHHLIVGVGDNTVADIQKPPMGAPSGQPCPCKEAHPGKTVSPGSGAVQASHLKCSLGSDGCPIPARLMAAILNSYKEPSVKPSTCMDFNIRT